MSFLVSELRMSSLFFNEDDFKSCNAAGYGIAQEIALAFGGIKRDLSLDRPTFCSFVPRRWGSIDVTEAVSSFNPFRSHLNQQFSDARRKHCG